MLEFYKGSTFDNLEIKKTVINKISDSLLNDYFIYSIFDNRRKEFCISKDICLITKINCQTFFKLIQKWNGIIYERDESGFYVIIREKYIYWENEKWAKGFLNDLMIHMILNKIIS